MIAIDNTRIEKFEKRANSKNKERNSRCFIEKSEENFMR